MKKASSGKAWPYAIGAAITMVFGFCVATIVVTNKADLQESNAYMTHYQDADARANEIIEAKIKFDKKYNLTYISEYIKENGSDLIYKIVDKDGNYVNNAKVVVVITRPETSTLDKKLENPLVVDGVYTFKDVKFPKAGVWDIMAKVDVGDDTRFLNVKVDTRNSKVKEF